MPNIKSAKKRVKINEVKTLRNKSYLSSVRTAIKSALTEKTEDKVKLALKKLDMSVSKGILHKNTAARKKAQLLKEVK